MEVTKDGAATAASGPTTQSVHVDTPLGSRSKRKPKMPPGIMVDPPKDVTPVSKFLKADADRRYTLGVVYAPLVVDSQGDLMTADEIEQSCWDFNQGLYQLSKAAQAMATGLLKAAQGQAVEIFVPDETLEKGALGQQHRNWDDGLGDIVESYIQRCDMPLGDQQIAAGTWLMGVIWSEAMWAKVQSGEITGYSMGGTGKRVPLELEGADA